MISFPVTFFTSPSATQKSVAEHTADSLAELIRATTAPTKAALPWLKLATFGEARTDKGSLRHDGNVTAITGLEADYDDETVALEVAAEKLLKAGVASIAYTSPSHTADKPRWRVLCPLSAPLDTGRREHLMGRLNGVLGGILARESWALSQSYYYGSVNQNPAHQVQVIEGDPIDLLDELDAIWIDKPGKRAGAAPTAPAVPLPRRPRREQPADNSRSVAVFRLSAKTRRDGGDFQAMCDAVRDNPETAAWFVEKGMINDRRELRRIWERTDPFAGDLILMASAPLGSAKQFIGRNHTLHAIVAGAMRTIHHQNGAFYTWQRTAYVENAPEEIRASLYRFLDTAKTYDENGDLVAFNPNKNRVANVTEALAAEAQLPQAVQAPAWLDGAPADAPKPTDLIACNNGLLHIPTRRLYPHTPAFFSLNVLPFDFDPQAPEPARWLDFLDAVWPSDQQSIDLLQEMFGLCLTADTSHQKAFLIAGPKRSGKGTIARILTALLGAESVCSPTLSSLSTNFGLAPMIGKRVSIISDARLSGKADQAIIAERLLSITGEDSLTIDRKYREGWHGKLDTRFLILTNELPRLTDASGALASRFLVLVMTRSFYGQEDRGLLDALLAELPGILVWALAGLDRLRLRGHFIPPASADEAVRELEDLGSPVGAFLRDACVVGPEHAVACDGLYAAWQTWCSENGRDHPGSVQTFGRDIRAAVPGLSTFQPRGDDGKPRRFYQGVGFSGGWLMRDDARTTPLYS